MNKLVEEIKTNFKSNGIKKVIGIYGGRFQPFGPHHYKTYKWLQSKLMEIHHNIQYKKTPKTPNELQRKS